MIEDTDGDGTFDKRSVFAENLVLPNGAQWYDGALYVCSPPFIWRYEDTDGDGKADKEERIFGKFNFGGNSSAFHGPVLGPDGRFYWCGGQHGWILGDLSPDWNYDLPWTTKAPGVFSVWPDGSDYEVHSLAGVANPVEVTFTPEGDTLGTVAIFDQNNGRHDALVHWIYGGIYSSADDRIRATPGVKYTGDALKAFSRRGHVAPCGVVRFRGDQFGPRYENDVFLCEFNTHKVFHLDIERAGSTYRAQDNLFVSSSNPYVHFTDVMQDADGSLLVIDTGGWFFQGCPTSRIARPEVLGAIYRVRKIDDTPVEDARGLRLAWEGASIEEHKDKPFVSPNIGFTVVAAYEGSHWFTEEQVVQFGFREELDGAIKGVKQLRQSTRRIAYRK